MQVDASETIGSLAGATGTSVSGGAVDATLTTGANNTSTSFSGTISDGSGGGFVGLTKVGTAIFTLSGTNSYTGPPEASEGTLSVNGSIVSPTTVDDGEAARHWRTARLENCHCRP